jgi:hypothetical protein
MKRRPLPTWLAVAALLASLPACNDEILTDVDIPRDASSDRGTDAPKESASSNDGSPEAPTTDAGADSNTDAAETDEASDSPSGEPE